jgi:hypothetical protein
MTWKIGLAVFIINAVGRGQITISEVMFDPATSEYHDEFIEIFNLSYHQTFDVTGLIFSDSTGVDVLKPHRGGDKIAPRRFALILDGSYFENSDTYDLVIPDSVLILKTSDNSIGSGGLSNSQSEQLTLMDSTSRILSTYRYSIDNQAGFSDEKIILDSISIPSNWGNSKRSGGTPGFRNSITPLSSDPGLDQSSLIIPDRIYTDEKINIIIRIYNLGLGKVEENILVYLYSDENQNFTYDTQEHLYLERFITLTKDPPFFEIEVEIPALKAGRHLITLQILSDNDENQENNIIVKEVIALDRNRSVRINEIKFLTFDQEPEWIELTNIGNESINIEQWAICDLKDTAVIDSSILLNPGQYKVLAADSVPQNYAIPESLVIIMSNFPTLNNSSDDVRLIRPDGSWLEYIKYDESWLEGYEQFNRSLERINPALYANNKMNWGPCVFGQGATPGKQNSIFSGLLENPLTISAYPDPFSPDYDGIDDVTVISGNLPELRSAIRVRIFDIRGRLVRTLEENQFSGSEFNVVWDGLDDNGRPARMGIYLIFMETINDVEGILRELKCSVVLAQKL